MVAFLKRMIIPTMILLWSLMYVIETRSHSHRDVLLVRPLFILIGITYLIIFLKEFFCKKNVCSNDVAFISAKEIKILILMITYIFAIKYLGFILTSFLSMLVMLYILDVKKISSLVIFSFLSTAVLYFAFEVILMVPLPSGIWGL